MVYFLAFLLLCMQGDGDVITFSLLASFQRPSPPTLYLAISTSTSFPLSTSSSNDSTLMTATETTPKMQAIRLVTKADNDNEDPSSTTESEVIHLAVHPDPASGKDVILWDDITTAFDDVLQVRSGTLIQSFLKGADFKM